MSSSTFRVFAESGLEVRRVGPPAAGSAVVVVLEPGVGADVVHDRLGPVSAGLRAEGASVYWAAWSRSGPELAGVGLATFRDTVLPRVFRRVVRDAEIPAHGSLHVVGLGIGGTLAAAALAEADRSLPPGRLVLWGSVVDPRRAPSSRRLAVMAENLPLEGQVVDRAAVAALAVALQGPRGWLRQLARVLDQGVDPTELSGRISGALVSDLAQPVATSADARRPVVVVGGAGNAVRSTAACRPAATARAGAPRVVSLDGAGSPIELILGNPAVLNRQLFGALA
jgi:hypothetical protein